MANKIIAYGIRVAGLDETIGSYGELLDLVKQTRQDLKHVDPTKDGPASRKALERYAAAKEAQKQFNATVRETQKTLAAAGDEADGSYRQLQNTMSVLKRQFKELSREERNSQIGEDLKERTREISNELKEIDAELGDYYRNVGNYEGGVTAALSRLDFGGILKGDLSSITNLTDGLGGATDATAGLAAQGALLGPAFAVGAIAAGITGAVSILSEAVDKTKEAKELVSIGGGVSNEDLNSTTGSLLATSQLLGESTQETFEAANAVAKQYNITLEESLDLIKDAALSGANVTGELLDQAREYPVFFRELGVSASQFFSIVSQSAKQGIFSDKGVDAIKEAEISLRELPKTARDAVNALGIDDATIAQVKSEEGVLGLMQLVIDRFGELNPQGELAGQVLADVFKGAGEDAGAEFIASLDLTNKGIGEQIDLGNRLVRQQRDRFESLKVIAEEQAKIEAEIGPAIAKFDLLRTRAEGNLFSFFGGLLDLLQDTTDAFSGVTREAELMTERLEDQTSKVGQLEGELEPLLNRYQELTDKGVLFTDEQEELNGLVVQIGEIMPGAITSVDDYGKALGVSASKARELIDAEQARLEILNEDSIKANEKSLTSLKARREELQKLIEVGREDVKSGSDLTVGFFASDEEIENTLSIELSEERRLAIQKEILETTRKILGTEAQLNKDRGIVQEGLEPNVSPEGTTGESTDQKEARLKREEEARKAREQRAKDAEAARNALTGLREIQAQILEINEEIAAFTGDAAALEILNAQASQLVQLEEAMRTNGLRLIGEAQAALPEIDVELDRLYQNLRAPDADFETIFSQIINTNEQRALLINRLTAVQEGLATPEQIQALEQQVSLIQERTDIEGIGLGTGLQPVTSGEDQSDPLADLGADARERLNEQGQAFADAELERAQAIQQAYQRTAEIASQAFGEFFASGERDAEAFARAATNALLDGIDSQIQALAFQAGVQVQATVPPPAGLILGGIATAGIIAGWEGLKASLTSFADGGVIDGPSHAQGGVKYPHLGVELQGDEGVTNDRAMKSKRVFHNLTGTTAQIGDFLNRATGGRPWIKSGRITEGGRARRTSRSRVLNTSGFQSFMDGGVIGRKPFVDSFFASSSLRPQQQQSISLSDSDVERIAAAVKQGASEGTANVGSEVANGAAEGIARAEDIRTSQKPIAV